MFWILTIIGAVLRILWVLCVPNSPFTDFKDYYNMAESIFHNQGISLDGTPVAYQGSGYPFILGYYYKLIGNTTIFSGEILNVILSVSTLFVCYQIFNKLFPNKKWTYTAYGSLVIFPKLIAYTNILGTETVCIFMLSLCVYIQLTSMRRTIKYPILGTLIAILSLIKPYFLVYPIVVCFLDWLQTKELKRQITALISITLIMAIVISPWTYRNYELYNRFIPISYNGGYNLYFNNNSDNHRGGWIPFGWIHETDELKHQLDELHLTYGDITAKAEPLYKQAAEKWILHHPIQFLKLSMLREQNLWFRADDIDMFSLHDYKINSHTKVSSVFMSCFQNLQYLLTYATSFLSLMYIVLNIRVLFLSIYTRKGILPVEVALTTINLLFYTFISFVFEGQARYNFPTTFLTIPASILCVLRIKHIISSRYHKDGVTSTPTVKEIAG